MIDNFALLLSHTLLMVAAWRLLSRRDLDDDRVAAPPAPPPRARGWTREGENA
jgi:hypothetical protein